MPLIKLKGSESIISIHLEHPISIDDDTKYCLGLVGFYSENNIYNILSKSEIYFWKSDVKPDSTILKIVPGYYTLENIQEQCRAFIKQLKIAEANTFIVSKAGTRISIQSPIKFFIDSNIQRLLGFELSNKFNKADENSYCNANKLLIGSKPPNLRPVDVIEVHCNIVDNSLVKHETHSYKHAESEILYTFYPHVLHGYKISHTPQERLYLPIKQGLRKIDTITITIRDENHHIIQNDCVNNVIYLDLKKQK